MTGAFLSNNIYSNPYITLELMEDSLEPFNALMELTIFLLFGLFFRICCSTTGCLGVHGSGFDVVRPLSVLYLGILSVD